MRSVVIERAYISDIDTLLDWQRAAWQLTHLDWPIVRPHVQSCSLYAAS
jgi:hypothetical protein